MSINMLAEFGSKLKKYVQVVLISTEIYKLFVGNQANIDEILKTDTFIILPHSSTYS